jgi:hypothetical protein
MPELTSQSTPPPLLLLPPPPASLIREWETLCVFRETFLVWLTPPGAADAFRYIGNLFFDLMLKADDWPVCSESPVRAELRGAAADLRFLEGYLATLGQTSTGSSVSPENIHLSQFATRQATEVARIAHRIEEELEQWQEKAEGA